MSGVRIDESKVLRQEVFKGIFLAERQCFQLKLLQAWVGAILEIGELPQNKSLLYRN